MSTPTKNYGFTKDNENDFYNVNTVNNNLDKIDTEMKRIEEEAKSYNQQVADNTTAITVVDMKVDKHIKDDSGHVRFIGNASGGTGMACRTDLAPVDLVNGKLVPRKGHAFRFLKADIANNGPHTFTIVSDTLPGNPGSATYPILNGRGQQLKGGEMVKDGIYTLVFNGSGFILQGEGGGYYKGDTLLVKDLINKDYVDIGQRASIAANGAVNYNLMNHEVAVVNGVEYTFSYCGTTRDSAFFCYEAQTGKLVWKKNVKYEYRGSRIVVHAGKIYVTIYDYDNVLGQGGSTLGLEVMDALTGTTLKVSSAIISGYGISNVPDICLVDINGTKEIMALVVNYGYYAFLCRYRLDGTMITTSSNLSNIDHTNGGTPSMIQYASSYVFLASGKAIYSFFANTFSSIAKHTPPDNTNNSEYYLLSMAANNIGGVSYLDQRGYLYVLGSTLTLMKPAIPVYGNNTSGLAIKGDLLGYATPTDIHVYRLATDGSTLAYLAGVTYPTDVTNTYTSKSIGLSENVVVPPKVQTKDSPSIYVKALTIQR